MSFKGLIVYQKLYSVVMEKGRIALVALAVAARTVGSLQYAVRRLGFVILNKVNHPHMKGN